MGIMFFGVTSVPYRELHTKKQFSHTVQWWYPFFLYVPCPRIGSHKLERNTSQSGSRIGLEAKIDQIFCSHKDQPSRLA